MEKFFKTDLQFKGFDNIRELAYVVITGTVKTCSIPMLESQIYLRLLYKVVRATVLHTMGKTIGYKAHIVLFVFVFEKRLRHKLAACK